MPGIFSANNLCFFSYSYQYKIITSKLLCHYSICSKRSREPRFSQKVLKDKASQIDGRYPNGLKNFQIHKARKGKLQGTPVGGTCHAQIHTCISLPHQIVTERHNTTRKSCWNKRRLFSLWSPPRLTGCMEVRLARCFMTQLGFTKTCKWNSYVKPGIL